MTTPLIRSSLRSWIERNADFQVCGEAENGMVAVQKVEEMHPDIVITGFANARHGRTGGCAQDKQYRSRHGHGDVHHASFKRIVESGSGCGRPRCCFKDRSALGPFAACAATDLRLTSPRARCRDWETLQGIQS